MMKLEDWVMNGPAWTAQFMASSFRALYKWQRNERNASGWRRSRTTHKGCYLFFFITSESSSQAENNKPKKKSSGNGCIELNSENQKYSRISNKVGKLLLQMGSSFVSYYFKSYPGSIKKQTDVSGELGPPRHPAGSCFPSDPASPDTGPKPSAG